MNKTIKIYLVLLALIIAGAAAIEFSKPKPINWYKTYNEKHKSPYGTYVLFDQFKTLFPKSNVKKIRVTPYEYFDKLYNWKDSTYTITGNYMLIDGNNNLDDVSAQELLDFASHGNAVFIATNYLPQKLLNALKIDTKYHYNLKGKASFFLANPIFKKDSLSIEKNIENQFFHVLDSASTTVLGYQKFDSVARINYIKVAYGNGCFYIHLQPIVFTNYHLLKNNNKKYVAAVLSYLNDDTIYFDSRNKIGDGLSDSPLRFILSKPALRWAWYLGLISLLCFIIFNAKRKQRIVKIIKPVENTTVAFTKTIGNLYYETKDHQAIVDKKITFFLETIRRKYYLDTQLLDDKFIKNLSLKSNKNPEDIKKLVHLILKLKAQNYYNEADLLKLNKAIETFYNN